MNTTGADDHHHDSFYWLTQINKASAVMLVRQGIISKPLGRTIADAIAKVDAATDKPAATRSGDYGIIEPLLMAVGGPDVSRLHSGRSRVDLAATQQRLFQREALLTAFSRLNETRLKLLSFAEPHANAIVPAYTQGRQAAPISLAHYLLAFSEAFSREAINLRQTYSVVNQSPLGSGTAGTSSFPIDRCLLAALLGFDDVIENSFDATQIASISTGAKVVSLVTSTSLVIGTFLADLDRQYSRTTPWITVAEGALTKTSTSMPHKVNPAILNQLRRQASSLLGLATSYTIKAHNVPHGQADYRGTEPQDALRAMADLTQQLGIMIDALEFSAETALDEVNGEYVTTPELANVLQRVADVPFRVGFCFAAKLVEYGRRNKLRPAEIPYYQAERLYTELVGLDDEKNTRFPLTEQDFRRSLTPENMVESSLGLGGPQPAEVSRMLASQTLKIKADSDWVDGRVLALSRASETLSNSFSCL